MNIQDRVKSNIDFIKGCFSNEEVLNDFGYAAFIVSLLPIPVIQQSAQIVDRIIANNSLKIKFDEIWTQLNNVNRNISSINDELKKAEEIANTLKYNSNINNDVKDLVNKIILELPSEWKVTTEDYSIQKILNSLVNADQATIVSRNNSTNIVENTKIIANKTELTSINNSENCFNNVFFNGNSGGVSMNNITTNGNLLVQDSSIRISSGSSIRFGGNPYLLQGECPICQTPISVDKRVLDGAKHFKCNKCLTIMEFTIY